MRRIYGNEDLVGAPKYLIKEEVRVRRKLDQLKKKVIVSFYPIVLLITCLAGSKTLRVYSSVSSIRKEFNGEPNIHNAVYRHDYEDLDQILPPLR